MGKSLRIKVEKSVHVYSQGTPTGPLCHGVIATKASSGRCASSTRRRQVDSGPLKKRRSVEGVEALHHRPEEEDCAGVTSSPGVPHIKYAP